MMQVFPRDVVAWAAQECEWQQSGEVSVLWMLDGWYYLRGVSTLTGEVVQRLGGIVEPRKNDGRSWRQVGVRVGMDVKMPPHTVPGAMEQLLDAVSLGDDLDVDEWFRQYEEIHPFSDGNGRTGNLLWNWLRGSLEEPKMPPNLWKDPRRD